MSLLVSIILDDWHIHLCQSINCKIQGTRLFWKWKRINFWQNVKNCGKKFSNARSFLPSDVFVELSKQLHSFDQWYHYYVELFFGCEMRIPVEMVKIACQCRDQKLHFFSQNFFWETILSALGNLVSFGCTWDGIGHREEVIGVCLVSHQKPEL